MMALAAGTAAGLMEDAGTGGARDGFDVVCFSHLRWDFVFQRPQHLLTRAARTGRVVYWEEPLMEAVAEPFLRRRVVEAGVVVVQPVLPVACADPEGVLRGLVEEFLAAEGVREFVSWYYTPMALGFTAALQPAVVVYDCMDELSAFRGAPPELLERERALLARADVVFVGGASLFQSKRSRHASIHLFPSSVDVPHFAQAREALEEPADQREIARPRVGFYGVLDERLDIELLEALADLRPGMQFVIVGPLAKIGEADLPRRANLHYLGPKQYEELPRYLAGWDAAMLPFARNEATRFISPTKTPEYLAAHRQVVSTAITDVVAPYGELGLVVIAEDAAKFAAALDEAVQPPDAAWIAHADAVLAGDSWDSTWHQMREWTVNVLKRAP